MCPASEMSASEPLTTPERDFDRRERQREPQPDGERAARVAVWGRVSTP